MSLQNSGLICPVHPRVCGEYLGADVARYGDDSSVLTHRQGNSVLSMQEFKNLSTTEYAALIMQKAVEESISSDQTVIDGVGIGAGVIDALKDQNFRAKEFIGGSSPINTPDSTVTFRNLRSQAYWNLRELFKSSEIEIPDNQKLIEDLTAHRYQIDGDRMITILSKDKIKLKTGRSPDYGDSLMMAFAEPLIKTSQIDEVVII